jgi:hypothetical protein
MEPQEPKNNDKVEHENPQEKDPYAGIFFETDVLLEKAKQGCIERLRPLTTREPVEGELFAAIEVFNYQDFGLNYDTFIKSEDGVEANYEQFGDVSAVPGLEDHIEAHLAEKTTSTEQNEHFDEKMRERLFAFFSSCWKEAGGAQSKTPTYFCFEKEEDQLMDFETGETLSQEEIVSKLESKS